MSEETSDGGRQDRPGRTDALIEDLRRTRRRSLITDARYLDDEKLPEEERLAVLQEVFSRNIRERQISRLVSHLLPVLEGGHPDTALVYGPTGAGKTVTILHVLASFQRICQREGQGFRYAHVDLTSPKTHFAALNSLAIALDDSVRRYRKGIPVDLMQERIVEAINKHPGFLCVVVDEVDNIRPNPDAFLTFLAKTLPRRVSSRLILVLVTNRLDWERSLDPRILSVLKKTDLIFEPYDARDLLEILTLRVEKAMDSRTIGSGALEKIAAYASRETGDARKAVELLAKAVKVAEESSGLLSEVEVDRAWEVLEVDKTDELIRALAAQQRLTLEACYLSLQGGCRRLSTGQVHEIYRELCGRLQTRPLTQRRFSDMISHLDLYGLINARLISKGRFGKTREISGSLPPQVVRRLLSGQSM